MAMAQVLPCSQWIVSTETGTRIHRVSPRRLKSLPNAPFLASTELRISFWRASAVAKVSIPSILEEEAKVSSSPLIVSEALLDYELAATAFLRARSFYTYPEGRSIEAEQSHRRYMAALERKTLISKISGTATGFNLVACLIAMWPLSEVESCVPKEVVEVCKVTVSGRDFLIAGTLDVNQGKVLPGEIRGSRPEEAEATWKRAYISNFCVLEEMRRKGIGTLLVRKAQQIAKTWGVTDFYVHVVTTNEPAFTLYTKAGFTFEAEETIADAHLLARPRRKLLWCNLS